MKTGMPSHFDEIIRFKIIRADLTLAIGLIVAMADYLRQ